MGNSLRQYKEQRGRAAGKATAEAKSSGHAVRTILYGGGGAEAQLHALLTSALLGGE